MEREFYDVKGNRVLLTLDEANILTMQMIFLQPVMPESVDAMAAAMQLMPAERVAEERPRLRLVHSR